MPQAQIITSYGRRYVVRLDNGIRYDATTRSKRTDYACGDWVEITPINHEQAVIEHVLTRQSVFYRQDAHKSKLIAANVSLLLLVVAAEPSPSELFLQRALLAAEAADVAVHIVLNKADLPNTTLLAQKLQFYQTLNYPVTQVSALHNVDVLKPILHGHTTLLLGQSGMGKSTLTNALLGENLARTNGLSAALDSGKHTTTHAQLYDLNSETKIMDSPGLQEFGLHHLAAAQLLAYFPDLRHLHGQCRFHNCSHRAEPACAVKQAAEQGSIRPERLAFLQKITDELSR